MMRQQVRLRFGASLALAGAFACGDDTGTSPTDVTFGETSFVVVVNPPVNDLNEAAVPPPGSIRQGVTVAVDGGPTGVTDAAGVPVLAPVAAGSRAISVSDGGNTGEVSVSIAEADLRELAIALDAGGTAVMADVGYPFGGQVIEVTPSMSVDLVNDALAQSNRIVFFRAGTYTGDLVFSGSDVTLFGEGPAGGRVTLDGNVVVDGSRNRIRGVWITGDLAVPGSDFGLSFSQVAGALEVDGSNAVLLSNAFCGMIDISGSGTTALGNAGMAPLSAPAGC